MLNINYVIKFQILKYIILHYFILHIFLFSVFGILLFICIILCRFFVYKLYLISSLCLLLLMLRLNVLYFIVIFCNFYIFVNAIFQLYISFVCSIKNHWCRCCDECTDVCVCVCSWRRVTRGVWRELKTCGCGSGRITPLDSPACHWRADRCETFCCTVRHTHDHSRVSV